MDLEDRLHSWGARGRASIDGRARRRRRLPVVIAAISVAVIVAGALIGNHLLNELESADADTRPYTYRGLTVTVPASWPLNRLKCSTPIGDTILIPGNVVDCLYQQPRHISFVAFDTRVRIAEATTTHITIDGHPATVTTGISGGSDYVIAKGDPVTRIEIPNLQTSVTIQSPDRALVDRIAGTASVVDQDANGCIVQRRDLVTFPTDQPPVRDGAESALVPGTPIHLAFCRYADGAIEQSAAVTGPELTQVQATLNGLPAGLSVNSPITHVPSVCVDEREHPKGFTIVATYADGPPVTVWVRLGSCELLGASNGTHTGQRTQALVELVVDRVGDNMGWPMNIRPTRVP